jgi:nucleoside-diphosphate-sugar epimerase
MLHSSSSDNAPLSVLAASSGRHVLVTGATGFLGKVWLGMLLERVPTIRRVTVLARRSGKRSASARVRRLLETSPAFRSLRARLGARFFDYIEKKVRVVEGDVGRPNLGMDPGEFEALRSSFDALVHFAALTDFELDPADALRTNVRGTEALAELAARAGAAFVYVSTCYVAGNQSAEIEERISPGPFDLDGALAALGRLSADAEDTSREAKQLRVAAASALARERGFPNLYTFSKSLAERSIARIPRLNYALVRPSIVEGARRYPFPGWNEGLSAGAPILWLASRIRRVPYRSANRCDVVPVDTVARGVLLSMAALLDRCAPGHVFQLASSAANPITVGRIFELTSLAARAYHARGGAPPAQELLQRLLPDVAPAGPASLSWVRSSARLLAKALASVDRGDVARALGPAPDRAVGDALAAGVAAAARAIGGADRMLRSGERIVELYRPFVLDNDYVFRADRVLELSARLVPAERDSFAFDIGDLDWRRYWIDAEYPGLEKWCFPLIRGARPPEDLAPPRRPAAPAEPPTPVLDQVTHG